MIKLVIAVIILLICFFTYILTDKFKDVSNEEPYKQLVGKKHELKEDIQLINLKGIFGIGGASYLPYLKKVIPLDKPEEGKGIVLPAGQEVFVQKAIVVTKSVSGAKYSYLLCTSKKGDQGLLYFAIEYGRASETWTDKGVGTKFKFEDPLPW